MAYKNAYKNEILQTKLTVEDQTSLAAWKISFSSKKQHKTHTFIIRIKNYQCSINMNSSCNTYHESKYFINGYKYTFVKIESEPKDIIL